MLSIYSAVGHNFYGCSLYPFKRPKRIILISFQNLELLLGRSSSPVGYGIGIAEVVGSNPTRSTFIVLVRYGIISSSVLMNVGQKPEQCLGETDENKFLVGYLTIVDS
jgi:hypothetical protein